MPIIDNNNIKINIEQPGERGGGEEEDDMIMMMMDTMEAMDDDDDDDDEVEKVEEVVAIITEGEGENHMKNKQTKLMSGGVGKGNAVEGVKDDEEEEGEKEEDEEEDEEECIEGIIMDE